MKGRPSPRKAILLSLCALLLGGFLSGCSPTWKNLTAELKLEDFNYLFDVLKNNHPALAIKARTEGVRLGFSPGRIRAGRQSIP